MTAYVEQLLDSSRDHERIGQALLVALPELTEYLHALAFKMRGTVDASDTPC